MKPNICAVIISRDIYQVFFFLILYKQYFILIMRKKIRIRM